MDCLNQIKTALLSVSNTVSHYTALKKKPPYLVWAEDGSGDCQWADGRMTAQVITGTIDLFTLSGDPLVDSVQTALDTAGISWKLNSVQYEEDTKLLHYEWRWEVGDYNL
ncbi:MAG: hypothetical protein RR053_06090 [Evtepia sp.]